MLASEHPVELKLKGVEQLTKMIEDERKVFTESNVLAVWWKISSFNSMSEPEISLAIMRFMAEVGKYHSSSINLQKSFLEFLCNDAILNCDSDNIWSSVTNNLTLLLNDIVLPENYVALSKALIFLSSMFARASETKSAELKTSIVSAVTTYSDFIDNDVFLVCFRSAIAHLKANSKNVNCLRESTNMLCALLKSKPSALNVESINEVIFLCEIEDVLNSFHLIADIFEEILHLSIWRHFVYSSYCEVLKSVASSFRRLPRNILKQLNGYVNDENPAESCDFGPLLEMILAVFTHVDIQKTYIDKEALVICSDFIQKRLLEPRGSNVIVSSNFHSCSLLYDILEKVIDRQKLRERCDMEIRDNFEKLLTQVLERVILMKNFEIVESLKLLHLMDASCEITTFEFKMKFFDFSFKTVWKTLDVEWMNRFEIYLTIAVGKLSSKNMKLDELLKMMSQLLKDSKVMNMYEQEILLLLLSKVRNCEEDPSLMTISLFDFCFEFSRLCARCSVNELLECLCEFVLRDSNGKDPNSSEFLERCFLHLVTFDACLLKVYNHHVSLGKHFCTFMNILNKVGHLVHHKHEERFTVKPEMRSKVLCLLIKPGLLRAFDQLCESSSSNHDCQALEATIVLGLKLVLECLKSESDWNVFSSVIVQLSAFLPQQETVEKIFGNRILKGLSDMEGNNELISLGCTFLEQLVIELCSLVDVKSFAFKKRFEYTTLHADNSSQFVSINDQISTYRALVFQCLIYMVTYQLDVKHRRIVSCFANGIQDSRCGVTCLSALTVCILEYPLQSCSRLIPSILDNIFKMKSSRSMSVPALNFIFMLSQLPTLHHNFRCEDHKQVMVVILQFVDYSSYSKYCAEVALNLLCLWFLKCKVSYRLQLAQLIVTELRNRLLKFHQDVQLQSKCTTSKMGSFVHTCCTSNASGTSGLCEQPEVVTTKSDTNKSSLRQLAALQEVALNLCQDMVSRNIFSDSSQITPKRSRLGELLLNNGLTKTWIYNDRIVTITTSGESHKVMANGLCRNCNDKVGSVGSTATTSVPGRSDRSRHRSSPQTPNAKDQRNHSVIREGIELTTANVPTDVSTAHQCACWISGWAEVYIRTPTGDMSFLNRSQLQRKTNVLSNLDFPLERMSLLMPTFASSRMESGDIRSQTSSCSSVDFDETFEPRDSCTKPRMSIALVGAKNRIKLEANLTRSKSLDDVSQLLTDRENIPENKKSKPSHSNSKQQLQYGSVKRRHESGFSLGSRSRNFSGDTASQLSPEMNQSNPAHIFAQLFATSASNFTSKASSSQAKLVSLPDTEDTKDDLNYFDNYLPISAHKVGVLYVDEGQQNDESAILANICGSERYGDFIKGLGSVICLSDYTTTDLKLYTGGLDKSTRELDGKFAICWMEELFHVVFHVATLMPTPDLSVDPQCRRKKALIGNDAVVIVYNDSKSPLTEKLIETELNFVTVLVTPTDRKRSSVRILFKQELEPWVIHASREEKIVSDKNVPVYVRQMALHASMACHGYLFRQKNLDYTSNWSKRLELIRKMSVKYGKTMDLDPLSDLV